MSAVSIQGKQAPRRRSPRQGRLSHRGLSPRTRLTQSLSCMQEVALIDRYLTSDLDPQLLQAFDAHLKACPECVAFLATYRKTIEITGAFLELQSRKQRARRLTLKAPRKPAARQ